MKTVRQAQHGKITLRLVKTPSGYGGVIIKGGAVHQQIDGLDPDDVWRRLEENAGKASVGFLGFDGAKKKFLRTFGGGFGSTAYITHERQYKVDARERLLREAPLESALSGSGFGEAILGVFRATNLLSPFEKVRLQDVLRGSHADSFVRAAAAFTRGDSAALARMDAALKPHESNKWTVATYLPFLWDPEQHMFLKPTVTKNFAARVGHRFEHEYSAKLEQKTYASLLDLVATLEKEVSDLKPADRIDLQSFIWVVGEYTPGDQAEVSNAALSEEAETV